jgi:hypothetical protein
MFHLQYVSDSNIRDGVGFSLMGDGFLEPLIPTLMVFLCFDSWSMLIFSRGISFVIHAVTCDQSSFSNSKETVKDS